MNVVQVSLSQGMYKKAKKWMRTYNDHTTNIPEIRGRFCNLEWLDFFISRAFSIRLHGPNFPGSTWPVSRLFPLVIYFPVCPSHICTLLCEVGTRSLLQSSGAWIDNRKNGKFDFLSEVMAFSKISFNWVLKPLWKFHKSGLFSLVVYEYILT